MDKGIKIKYWVDVTMFCFLLLTGITGILAFSMIMFMNPLKTTFLGLSPTFWFWIHPFFAITTVCLVLIHLLLHKEWIVFTSKKIFQGPPKPKI
jgi:hypothetical protein